MHHFNAHLSIYRKGDAPAIMIKGGAPAFVMGDLLIFMIKGDALLAMRVSFTCIIGDAQ
jgi:hypothetical protein